MTPDPMLASDVDLVIAIRDNNADGAAKALEGGAAVYDVGSPTTA